MLTYAIIVIFLQILFIHWFADFICQTPFQAVNKSKRLDALVFHVLSYSILTTALWLWVFPIPCTAVNVLFIFCVNFFAHLATDFTTSRLNGLLYRLGKNDPSKHWFFVGVGFDQILHYIQLFWLYSYIVKI